MVTCIRFLDEESSDQCTVDKILIYLPKMFEYKIPRIEQGFPHDNDDKSDECILDVLFVLGLSYNLLNVGKMIKNYYLFFEKIKF